jgi:hypothetical protein
LPLSRAGCRSGANRAGAKQKNAALRAAEGQGSQTRGCSALSKVEEETRRLKSAAD